jgi:hypothetical protein
MYLYFISSRTISPPIADPPQVLVKIIKAFCFTGEKVGDVFTNFSSRRLLPFRPTQGFSSSSTSSGVWEPSYQESHLHRRIPALARCGEHNQESLHLLNGETLTTSLGQRHTTSRECTHRLLHRERTHTCSRTQVCRPVDYIPYVSYRCVHNMSGKR